MELLYEPLNLCFKSWEGLVMFEKASRLKLRFNYKGVCGVEDLWDISLTGLDSIYKQLNNELKQAKEESLLEVRTPADELLALKVDIVKYIFTQKQQEKKDRENALVKADKKRKLLNIIAEKQDSELRNMSIDDLNKLADEL